MIEIHLFSLMLGLTIGSIISAAIAVLVIFKDTGAWSVGFQEGMKYAREKEREQMKGGEE